MMLSWLDNERVTRWFAIALAPVVFICYAVGFHYVFGEFGGGDGSLPELTSFFIVFVMCGTAYRSITERMRLQVNRERDESEAQYRVEVEAKLKATKTEIWRAWAMGNSGPFLDWVDGQLNLKPTSIITQPVAWLTPAAKTSEQR